jgi:cellulose synthase/poly-beta-1,6-N-acetylglucosamine synthase-like glycosyltransferase
MAKKKPLWGFGTAVTKPLPMVSVGILVRNQRETILKTLQELVKLTYPKESYELIVVDGRSTDGTREAVEAFARRTRVRIRLIREEEHALHGERGRTFARNLVVRLADKKARSIAFTDADCIVERDWLTRLVTRLQRESAKDASLAGVGGPRLIFPTTNAKELVINTYLMSVFGSGGSPVYGIHDVSRVESIANCNAIYLRRVLEENPYDNALVPDDSELNFRLRLQGKTFCYEPSAIVRHTETDSILTYWGDMYRYGFAMGQIALKHKRLPRWYAVVPVLFVLCVMSALFADLFPYIIQSLYLLAAGVYLTLLIVIFLFVLVKTRRAASVITFLLVPGHHILYGLGMVKGLFQPVRRIPG